MILKYLDFILENKQSTKARFYYSDNFRSILKSLSEKNRIAETLYMAEDSDVILDSYTLIDITDKNDYISMVDVNKLENKYPNSVINGEIKNNADFFNNEDVNKIEMKIGRWTTRFLREILNIQLDSSKIEIFVNLYKSSYEQNKGNDKFLLVEGDEIRKWYLEDNYYNRDGQLYKSCMKYKDCQDFLEIYTKNPEVCKLLILKKNGKLSGRSLIWKLTDGSYYMDRIYTNFDSDIERFKEYADSNKIKTKPKQPIFLNKVGELKVQLGDHTYEKYPYMDTFLVYNLKTKILSNNEKLWPSSDTIKLQETDGDCLGNDIVWSTYGGRYINKKAAVWCDRSHEYLPKEEARFIKYANEWANPDYCVYSNTKDEYYYDNESVYSRTLHDYIYKKDPDIIKIKGPDGRDDYKFK